MKFLDAIRTLCEEMYAATILPGGIGEVTLEMSQEALDRYNEEADARGRIVLSKSPTGRQGLACTGGVVWFRPLPDLKDGEMRFVFELSRGISGLDPQDEA